MIVNCLYLVRVREAYGSWLKRGRYTTDYVMPQQICVMYNVIAQAKKQVRYLSSFACVTRSVSGKLKNSSPQWKTNQDRWFASLDCT